MQPEGPQIEWLTPWHPRKGDTTDDGTARELQREICDRHVLHGVLVRTVGYRQDCDDVLFELLDGSGRLAVVHLTYAKEPGKDPRWPRTTMLEDWQRFKRKMQNDHAEWDV